ncbi:MAG: Putative amidohydrolase [Candidatus Tokpelaia hoelldobleri]|uniref:Amidohydrolase n=1 Tax=Candidatus Tokpelaia hoelldobleri TaxID=1902579 RepID=A0A1U9JV31_9HYPH|nr:MAG: Putative amidohydrolase [Candidatus Tokpelaia hoelldoblerii]
MDIIIRNVCLEDGSPLQDVAVKDGKIADIAPEIVATAGREINAGGRVLIPGLVESHLHLEKAFIMDRRPNRSGTLWEAIDITKELKPTFTREDILERSQRVIRQVVRFGTTHIRAHAEFDPSQGFTGFDAICDLREQYKGIIDIQVVAFPQEGIFKVPGTQEMMVEAMKKGADVVGGIPYNDLNKEEHIDFVFELAREFGKDIDLHQDFKDDHDEDTCIEYLARKTIKEGYEGRVSCGHVTSLGAAHPEKLKDIIKLIADAGISIMSLPMTDLHLGARKDEYNVRRTLTPIRALRDGGVNMCLATNNIRNAFTPYGTGDLLQVGMLAIPAAHLGGADDQATVMDMLTVNPARAIGLKDYGLAKGNSADMVLLDTKSATSAVIDLPERLFVIKGGRIVAQSIRETLLSF